MEISCDCTLCSHNQGRVCTREDMCIDIFGQCASCAVSPAFADIQKERRETRAVEETYRSKAIFFD